MDEGSLDSKEPRLELIGNSVMVSVRVQSWSRMGFLDWFVQKVRVFRLRLFELMGSCFLGNREYPLEILSPLVTELSPKCMAWL